MCWRGRQVKYNMPVATFVLPARSHAEAATRLTSASYDKTVKIWGQQPTPQFCVTLRHLGTYISKGRDFVGRELGKPTTVNICHQTSAILSQCFSG